MTKTETLEDVIHRLQHTRGWPMTGGEVTREAYGVEWYQATEEQRQAVIAACQAKGLRKGKLVGGPWVKDPDDLRFGFKADE